MLTLDADTPRRRAIVGVLAVLIGLLGAATLVEYAFHIDVSLRNCARPVVVSE